MRITLEAAQGVYQQVCDAELVCSATPVWNLRPKNCFVSPHTYSMAVNGSGQLVLVQIGSHTQ